MKLVSILAAAVASAALAVPASASALTCYRAEFDRTPSAYTSYGRIIVDPGNPHLESYSC